MADVPRAARPRPGAPRRAADTRPSDDYYVLTRHADIWAAARDHETFSSAKGLTVNYGDLEMIGLQDNPPMVMQDPPVHTEFRKLVSRGFTPRQVEAVEPKVREFVVERIERLRANGGGDIVAELFKPLPSMVVAHYLGVPEEDRDTVRRLDRSHRRGQHRRRRHRGRAGIRRRRGRVDDGLLHRADRASPHRARRRHHLASGRRGSRRRRRHRRCAVDPRFTFTMVTGGNDTVTGMLGGSVQLLHQRPDQRASAGRTASTCIPDAVDEFLRLTSPAQALARTVTRDVTIGDTTVPADRRVLLLYGSANRDERHLRLGRRRTRRAPDARATS